MSLEASIYSFGDFILDTDQKVLFENDEPVSITPKAFHLLSVLVECHGRIVEKEILINEVWPDSFVEESNLTFNIRQLRKILRDKKKDPIFIETVPRRGYRFVAEVKEGINTSFAATNHKKGRAIAHAPTWVAAAISAILLFTVFGLAFVLFRGQKPNFRDETADHLTDIGKVTVAAIAPDGRTLVFGKKDGIGESLWKREIATGKELQILPAERVEFVGLAVSPESDHAYYSVFAKNAAALTLSRVALDGGTPEALPEIASDVSVSFSPDGKHFAYTESHSAVNETILKTADRDGKNPKTLLTLKGEKRVLPIFRASPVAWSPDGRDIACAVQETEGDDTFFRILLVDPVDGKERYISEQRWADVENVVWKDNGNLVITNVRPNTQGDQVLMVSRQAGTVQELRTDVRDYSWLSASNGAIYAVERKTYSSLYIADFPDDSLTVQTKQIFNEPGVIGDIDWSRDDKLFYNSWASGRNEIWQINPDGTSPEQLTHNSNLTYGFTVSPTDNTIVFAAAEKQSSNLFISKNGERNIRRLTEGIDNFRPRFMPDGKAVVYQQGSIVKPTIWKVATDGEQPAKQLTGFFAQQPSVSTDGMKIAYQFMDVEGGDRKWRLGVMETANGRLLNKIDFPVLVSERKVVWRPGDDLLTLAVATGENSGFLILSPVDGSFHTIENVTNDKITSFVWSPDGKRLAFSTNQVISDVKVIN